MEDKEILAVEAHLASCDGRAYSPDERKHVTDTVFACMEAGESMSAACIRLQVTPGTIWRWLREDKDLKMLYDNIKVNRARAMIEAAIYEIQTNPDYKIADMRARTYLRLAAVLNPKEFSERMMAGGGKALPNAPVSFVLNFSGTPQHASRELTVVPQPEDGELS
jgi:hypothetical protein